MAGKRPRKKWEDLGDPLVPVSPARLRAALGLRRTSVKAIAERIGEHQQTIDLIARGRTQSTRRTRLQKLARALKVPTRWLSDESFDLPFPDEARAPRRDSARWRAIANQDDPERGALRQLLLSRYFERVIPRLWRDYPSPLSSAQAGDPERAREHQEEYRLVRYCLQDLVDPAMWRRRLFLEGHRLSAPLAGDDEVMEALATAFALLLAPWVEKAASLNADAVLEICGVAPRRCRRRSPEERSSRCLKK